MKPINEDDLKRRLKSGPFPRVWFIFGDDGYLKDFYLAKITDLTVPEDLRFFNLHTYNEDETSLEDIFADAENLPVMCNKTCLVVRNFPLQSLGTNQLDTLKKQLENIPETTVMIFFYNTVDVVYNEKKPGEKWTSIINLFCDCGTAVELNHRTKAGIAAMLVKKASARGTSISQEDALYFVNVAGDDMQTLINEFDKLCAYSSGEPVTQDMIDTVTVKSVEANVFEITSSVFAGDTDRAYEILDELLRQKAKPVEIIGAMANAYVNLYRQKTAASNSKTVRDFSEAYGYKNDWQFKYTTPYVGKMSTGKIRRSIELLLQTDIKGKTGAADETVLKELISMLAAV